VKSINSMTQGELAAYIESNLRKSGVNVVLSGGACVAIYSNHQYVSKDLDFIAQFSLDSKTIASVMKSLGFMPKGNISITHKPHISSKSSLARHRLGEILSMKSKS
jgi:hypothetical protein